jgi:hypothetical protein
LLFRKADIGISDIRPRSARDAPRVIILIVWLLIAFAQGDRRSLGGPCHVAGTLRNMSLHLYENGPRIRMKLPFAWS